MTDLQHIEYAKVFAKERILAYPDTIVYHNISFADRYLNYVNSMIKEVPFGEKVARIARLGAWLVTGSFRNPKVTVSSSGGYEDDLEERCLITLKEFQAIHPLNNEDFNALQIAFSELSLTEIPKTEIGKILVDAFTADVVMGNGVKTMRKIYEELVLADVSISKKKWNDIVLDMAASLKFHLPYCKDHFQPKLDTLLLNLEKESKRLVKTSDLALKKQLHIGNAELKRLKKNLLNSKGRDDRGIQTMFRTTSKNHYTLNEMVDRKASIMITVNSIILSLVLGGVVGRVAEHGHPHLNAENLPILILALTSTLSIIFAILSIRPVTTHGEFTEEEIRNKEGHLLYYGNFHKMEYEDFEWAFLEMMSDQDFLYGSMIKDIYFQGKNLAPKYKSIRLALNIFLVGMVLSVLSFFIARFFFP